MTLKTGGMLVEKMFILLLFLKKKSTNVHSIHQLMHTASLLIIIRTRI